MLGRTALCLRRARYRAPAAALLHPLELVARLAALVLPPWFHLVRYHGVPAPHATLRRSVVRHDTLNATPCGPLWLVAFVTEPQGIGAELSGAPRPPPSPAAPTPSPQSAFAFAL